MEGSIKQIAFNEFQQQLKAKAAIVYDFMMEEKNMPYEIINSNQHIIDKFAYEQATMGIDEFEAEQDEVINENNVQEKISDYLTDGYDTDFIKFNLEAALPDDEIKKFLTHDLFLAVTNKSPYGEVSEFFWKEKIDSIQSDSELAGYVKTQNVEEFVEKYAPEWYELRD